MIIILSSLKLFSTLKVSVSALTMAWPRAALPQPQSLGSKYQLELYRKALIKSLLHFSVSFILLVPQVLTGLVAGSCVVSELNTYLLSPVLFT